MGHSETLHWLRESLGVWNILQHCNEISVSTLLFIPLTRSNWQLCDDAIWNRNKRCNTGQEVSANACWSQGAADEMYVRAEVATGWKMRRGEGREKTEKGHQIQSLCRRRLGTVRPCPCRSCKSRPSDRYLELSWLLGDWTSDFPASCCSCSTF